MNTIQNTGHKNLQNKPPVAKEGVFNFYDTFYNTPHIQQTFSVSLRLFSYCKQGDVFVSVVIINKQGHVFLRSSGNNSLSLELPGGFVRSQDISYESAAIRIIKEEYGGVVDELHPLLNIENEFICNNMKHIHRGVVFIAYTRGSSNSNKNGSFFNKIPEKQIIDLNRRIIQYSKEYTASHPQFAPEGEIDEANSLGWRYQFHKIIVKPLSWLIASRFLRLKLREIILDETPNSVLDVSCGDDESILWLAKKIPSTRFIANDIAWTSISKLINKTKSKNLIFTNHNLESLPFSKKFDLVICKNTLHHIDADQRVSVVSNLKNLANHKLIIMDVEDPLTTSWKHRVWNKYYRSFLHDQGDSFMTYKEFCDLILNISPDAYIERIKTGKGVYMLALIENGRN